MMYTYIYIKNKIVKNWWENFITGEIKFKKITSNLYVLYRSIFFVELGINGYKMNLEVTPGDVER